MYARADGTTSTQGGATETPTDPPANDSGDTDDNPFPRERWRRVGRWQRFGGRLDADTQANHNIYNATDVNGDSFTSPIDALLIVNSLNRGTSVESASGDDGLCDTKGDGNISAIDVLTVINVLNSNSGDTIVPTGSSNETGTALSDLDDAVVIVKPDIEPSVEVASSSGEENESESSSESESETGSDNVDCQSDSSQKTNGIGLSVSRSNVFLLSQTAEKLMTRFDASGDGTLVEEEVPAKVWDVFVVRAVDTNSDAAVSLAELEMAITASRQEYFDERDTNADGLLTQDEVGDRYWAKLAEADTDEVADVSFDEFRTWIVARAAEVPHHHQHHHQHHRVDAALSQIVRAFRRFR